MTNPPNYHDYSDTRISAEFLKAVRNWNASEGKTAELRAKVGQIGVVMFEKFGEKAFWMAVADAGIHRGTITAILKEAGWTEPRAASAKSEEQVRAARTLRATTAAETTLSHFADLPPEKRAELVAAVQVDDTDRLPEEQARRCLAVLRLIWKRLDDDVQVEIRNAVAQLPIARRGTEDTARDDAHPYL